MSVPSKMIVPAVGSIRRRISRPTVVLPQPDSPTRPSALAAPDVEVDAIDGLDLGHRALEDAALDREDLDQPVDLDQRLVVTGVCSMARTVAPMSAMLTRRRLLPGAASVASARASGGRQSGVSSDVWYSQQRTL